MSTFNTRFGDNIASFLNDNFIRPVAAYIFENPEELKDKSAEEIVTILREVIDVSTTTVAASVSTKTKNVSSNAPNLATLVSAGMPTLNGMGTITAPAVSAKGKRVAKEKPEQKWFVLNEAQTLYEQQRPVCYYVSSRGENKDKVCCASIENDTDAMKEEEPANWRCANCTGKSSDIRSKFKTGPVKGNDPLKLNIVPGGNLPVLPGSIGPLPNLPVHPTALPPTFNTSIPTIGALSPAKPTVTKLPSPVKLSALPAMPSLPGMPSLPVDLPLAPLPAVAETLAPLPPMLAMPEVKPMSPPPKMKLVKHEGFKSNHFKASIPELIEIGIIIDYKKNADGTPNMKAIGKVPGIFNEKAGEGYEYKVEELSDSEIKTIRKYTDKLQYEYTKPMQPVDADLDIDI